MKKRMLSFVLALALCLTLLPTALAAGSASFSGGSGTAEDPYQISTAEDMFALADAVNLDNVSYEGSYFLLTKDIDLGNTPWTPIGDSASAEGRQFLGSFDGGGYTISGLEVDVGSGYVGLFGVVGRLDRDSAAEVKNLRVEGNVSAARTSSLFYIGGIAGFVGLGANLTDCSFQGTVEASASESALAGYAGGIAGYNMGTISGCSVSDSSISGISSSSGGVNYKILAAGIAAGNDASGTIENCTVEDSIITSSASDKDTQSCAGGIVADNIMGSITQCNVTGGSVSTQGPMLVSSVGGIAGGSDGKVTDCTNSASVKGPDNKNTADVAQGSGGIVGWNKNLVDQCINTGSVSSNKYAGGIVGYNTTNGEDTGTIHNSYNTGAVMGDDYIGGIVGCNYNTVAQCGNTGSVMGSGNYIGGVAGYNNNYTNPFTPTFIGTIENTYNTGAVTGGDYIGGIVGQAEDGACAYSYNCGTISSGQAANIGGVFGHIASPASAQNCYYLDTSVGSSAAVSGVESKTSEEFKSGEVAFLLNSGDPQQIWGQELGTDEAPILTDDADKSVVQVTFENSDATTTAQYANPGGTVDVPDITGTAPDGQVYGWFDADGNRYTDATSISADVKLTLALAYAVPAAGSGYTIDYAAETAAAAADYEISTDGQAWLDSGDGSIPIVPGRTLFVRYLGDGSVHISEPAENILASRPAAPDTVAGGRRQISGLTAAMEYQEPNSTVWVKITEDMLSNGVLVLPNLALGTYQVRYSAVTSGTAPAFASESLSVQVIQSSSGGGSSTPTYRPDVETTDDGTVTVTPRNPERGDKVTITPDPDTGYEVDDVTITDRNGDEVPVTDNGDGTWSFTQPTGKVTIEVTFREIPAEPEPLPFTDVPEDAWYSDAVRYVYENGLMAGTGAGAFSPNETTSRGMIATVLWRMAGSPQDNDQVAFSDVADGAWYAEAAHWAAGTGIASGYGGGLFGPDDPITREQLAVMLYQFARDQGYDLSIGQDTNILSYTDASEVSEYAVSALQWACGAGIISGTGDGSTLSPQGQATRAQTAVMLMRFCELDQ